MCKSHLFCFSQILQKELISAKELNDANAESIKTLEDEKNTNLQEIDAYKSNVEMLEKKNLELSEELVNTKNEVESLKKQLLECEAIRVQEAKENCEKIESLKQVHNAKIQDI